MTQDELAAVVAAVQAYLQQPEDAAAAQTSMSAWKRQARLEAAGLGMSDVR